MKKDLIKKAEEYGIDIEEFDNDDDLAEAIEKYEKENDNDNDDDDTDDVDKLKEQLEHWKEEAKKAFKDRDTAKQERRKVQKKIKELEDQIKDNPSKDDLKTLKEELKELKDYKKEMDEKTEEENRKKLSDLEKMELDYNKKLEKMENDFTSKIDDLTSKLTERDTELTKKEENIKTLRRVKLENQIMVAAEQNKAYNSKQIVKLLRDDFEYDADLDKFVHYKRDDKNKLVDEKDVEDRVIEFLKDPINANLVETKKKTGTDHDDLHYKKNDKDKKKSDKYDPNDSKIKEKADERGLSPEEYIETLVMRDERLAKVRGDKDN